MRTLMIAYDLATPARNKHALATLIMSLGSAWARPLDHTWLVRTDAPEQDVAARLARLIEEEDGLVVQPVSEPALTANTGLRWFRHRRDAHEIETNVIAFPHTPAPAAAEGEVPKVAA